MPDSGVVYDSRCGGAEFRLTDAAILISVVGLDVARSEVELPSFVVAATTHRCRANTFSFAGCNNHPKHGKITTAFYVCEHVSIRLHCSVVLVAPRESWLNYRLTLDRHRNLPRARSGRPSIKKTAAAPENRTAKRVLGIYSSEHAIHAYSPTSAAKDASWQVKITAWPERRPSAMRACARSREGASRPTSGSSRSTSGRF